MIATIALALLCASLPPAAAFGDDGMWEIVFEDDFAGPDLNLSSWNIAKNVTRTSEWQIYTEDNVYVDTGNLVIRTTSNQFPHNGVTYNFTSGWVDTLNKVELQYGKFEARIKLPLELPGVWPVYWMTDDNNQ